VNPAQAFAGGGNDAFVTKLNAAGTSLVYSTFLGAVVTTSLWDRPVGGWDGALTPVTGSDIRELPVQSRGVSDGDWRREEAYITRLNGRWRSTTDPFGDGTITGLALADSLAAG
jgi:hypothetical protein